MEQLQKMCDDLKDDIEKNIKILAEDRTAIYKKKTKKFRNDLDVIETKFYNSSQRTGGNDMKASIKNYSKKRTRLLELRMTLLEEVQRFQDIDEDITQQSVTEVGRNINGTGYLSDRTSHRLCILPIMGTLPIVMRKTFPGRAVQDTMTPTSKRNHT
jgi:hypothetical protein